MFTQSGNHATRQMDEGLDMWKVNQGYLVVLVLVFGGCCGRCPSTMPAESKQVLSVRVRHYVLSILESLDKNRALTDEQFRNIISSEELTGVLRQPNGFHRSYTLRVCATKQLWIDPLKLAEPLTMVTVAFDSNQDMSPANLFFDSVGKEMPKEGLPKSVATFITFRITDGGVD